VVLAKDTGRNESYLPGDVEGFEMNARYSGSSRLCGMSMGTEEGAVVEHGTGNGELVL